MFRKNHGVQHYVLALLGKWDGNIDQGSVFGALLTDLSKDSDILKHDLFITKMQAHGFDTRALRLIKDNVSSRIQRIKVGKVRSSLKETKHGIPQDPIFGPMFFNIDLGDLFFIIKDMIESISSLQMITHFICQLNITATI